MKLKKLLPSLLILLFSCHSPSDPNLEKQDQDFHSKIDPLVRQDSVLKSHVAITDSGIAKAKVNYTKAKKRVEEDENKLPDSTKAHVANLFVADSLKDIAFKSKEDTLRKIILNQEAQIKVHKVYEDSLHLDVIQLNEEKVDLKQQVFDLKLKVKRKNTKIEVGVVALAALVGWLIVR